MAGHANSPSACADRVSHPPAILPDMEEQLVLIEETTREWRLDDDTRRSGRRGLELARRALESAGRQSAA